MLEVDKETFPSPTGVNYYEYFDGYCATKVFSIGFRPQQVLTIMNNKVEKIAFNWELNTRFRPQQGLTIMNS